MTVDVAPLNGLREGMRQDFDFALCSGAAASFVNVLINIFRSKIRHWHIAKYGSDRLYRRVVVALGVDALCGDDLERVSVEQIADRPRRLYRPEAGRPDAIRFGQCFSESKGFLVVPCCFRAWRHLIVIGAVNKSDLG